MDTLLHDYLLLSLDDHSGKPDVVDGYAASAAIGAALWAELQLIGAVGAVSADRYLLGEAAEGLDGVLGVAVDRLRRDKPFKATWAISRLGHQRHRQLALEELVAGGVLREERDKLWIITWRRRWPTTDGSTHEEDLRGRLRLWLQTVSQDTPPGREDLLLSLLRYTKLLGQLWSEGELARLRPLIEERTRRAPVGQLAKQVADSTRAAVTAATAAATG